MHLTIPSLGQLEQWRYFACSLKLGISNDDRTLAQKLPDIRKEGSCISQLSYYCDKRLDTKDFKGDLCLSHSFKVFIPPQ